MDFSKDDHHPFVASERRHRFRLWVRVAEGRTPYYYIYWRRVFLVLAVLVFLAWLLAFAVIRLLG